MSFISPLLKTTRDPIWVDPLAWNLNHLHLLRISIEPILNTANLDDQEKPTIPSEISSPHKLKGTIAFREIKAVHYLQKLVLLDTYLATFIARIMATFQEELKSKPFRYRSSWELPEPPVSLFAFGETVVKVKAELVIHTKRGMPFLLYNCAKSTNGFRQFKPSRAIRKLPGALRKWMRACSFDLELIDPYYVAGLISFAQTQMCVLRYLDQPLPDMIKAYLITPYSPSAAVYFYTASFPRRYLEALQNPRLETTEVATITRELVELPELPEDGKDVTDGRFLDILTRVFEEANNYEKMFSEASLAKQQAKKSKAVIDKKAEKKPKISHIQKRPGWLSEEKHRWRKVQGVVRKMKNKRTARFLHDQKIAEMMQNLGV